MKKSITMFFCIAIAGTTLYAQNDETTKNPPPPPPPKKVDIIYRITLDPAELENFYKRNPSVEKIQYKSKTEVVLSFKDKEKKAEIYNLSTKAGDETFRDKYGDAPKLLPPPPPPPPKKHED